MNLKLLVMKKGVTQLELAQRLGINPSLLNQQIGLHRLLPEKHLEAFCDFMGIKQEELVKAMEQDGGANE